jgi:DivIVA domain-containing protein
VATFLVWVVTALVVAAAAFGVVVVLTGRADVMAEMPPDAVPVELPEDRPITASDLTRVRFDLALRGYRMDQVDALLDRLGRELADRDEEISALRSRLAGAPDG